MTNYEAVVRRCDIEQLAKEIEEMMSPCMLCIADSEDHPARCRCWCHDHHEQEHEARYLRNRLRSMTADQRAFLIL